MSHSSESSSKCKRGCLTADELCQYAAHPSTGAGAPELEAHLAGCERCQEELADVLKLLHPEADDPASAAPALSEEEIARTVALIQGVARKEAGRHARPWWFGWAAAAAASVVLLIAGVMGHQYLVIRTSNRYLVLARADLAATSTVRSPSGLRLELPFGSAVATRNAVDDSALKNAEIHFSQALSGRENAEEPHLGLAAVHLARSRFDEAREQFQLVLNLQPGHLQALIGRGVAAFEMARQAKDPIVRQERLTGALTDFDTALKQQPGSLEARHNRIWVLYETGRHQEALGEIDSYLAKDPDSIWAARLRELQTRMRLSKDEAVDREVNPAARLRDAAALHAIGRLAYERAPTAIRTALRESLLREGAPAKPAEPDSADLRWAAETLEAAYSAATGDRSWNGLIHFYAGLSPPQRKLKRELDRKFVHLADMRGPKPAEVALRDTESLEPQYALLNDTWQLFNIHWLRGECFYYQADFAHAEVEYRMMVRYAEKTGAPEMRLKGVAALTVVLLEMAQFDEMASRIAEIDRLAEQYGLGQWRTLVASNAGDLHQKFHQLQEALEDYSAALGFAYRAQNEAGVAGVLQVLVPLMSEIGRPKDAASLCAQGLEIVTSMLKNADARQRTPINARRLNLLYMQGEATLQAGELDLAEKSFLDGLRGPLAEMRELECRLRLRLVQVYLGNKRHADATSMLREAGMLARAGKFEELEWQADFLEGKILEESGDAKRALARFTQCIETLERMRGRISSDDLRRQFLNHRFDPYKEIVSLLHGSLQEYRRAAEFAGRAKSMTLREYLGNPDSDSAGTVNEIARSLGVWCIDYFFSTENLLAFVSGPDRIQAVALPITRVEIERTVKAYLETIRTGDERRFDVISRQLYDQIVGPVIHAAGMERCENLVLFPDGPLCLLPFGGLKDPLGRHLLETCTISYAPSSNVLRHCLSLERGSAAGKNRNLLLLDGTANLPAAGRELASISRLYPEFHFLNTGNLSAARGLAAEADILHFAGHATLKDGKPALLLEGPPHQVALDSAEIASWRLRRNRLVILAGCETGIGPQVEGEIPWSLIPAFLNAGSPALLVSLIPVEDAATAAFITSFYERLSSDPALGKAAVLRQTQRSFLSAARASGRVNPASWLPFILVGDPR